MQLLNSPEDVFYFFRNLNTAQRQDSLIQQLADLKPVLQFFNLQNSLNITENIQESIKTDYMNIFFNNVVLKTHITDNFHHSYVIANFLGCYEASDYFKSQKND